MSPRRFYRTVLTITVLSETPIPGDMDLSDILNEADEGSYMAGGKELHQFTLSAKEAVNWLYDFGSEPIFFKLDDDGNDIEEDDE